MKEIRAGLLAIFTAACASAPPPPPMPAQGGTSWPTSPARLTLALPSTLDPKRVPPMPMTRLLSRIDDFKAPESVLHDAEQDVYFVSNVNGPNLARDNNGFVSRVRVDGTVADRMFIAGGQRGVTLHAPKGMAVTGATLWVADIDVLRGFDRRTGAPSAEIDLREHGVRFLNDLAVAPGGQIWATDTGITYDERGIPVPGPSQLLRVLGSQARVMSTEQLLGQPNGVAWDAANDRLVVVSYGANRILSFKDGRLRVLATGSGQFDGVVVLEDGTILVSSQATSAVHRYEADGGGGAEALANMMGVADIARDEPRKRLLVPLTSQNRVEIHALPVR